MELQEFTDNALKTESHVDRIEFNKFMLDNALKAFIASSNILDMYKKNIFYGKPIDMDAFQLESSHLADGALNLNNNGHVDFDHIYRDVSDIDPRVFHAIIGICTESGELAELMLETMISGEFDVVNFGEELGDIDWYKAIGTDATGLDPTNILETVIKKLQKRYPDKFAADAAINRDVGGERELLEDNLEDQVYPENHWKQPY